MWSHDPTPTEILGVELAGRPMPSVRRLERRVRRMTVTVAWLRQYAIEHRAEPIVRPKVRATRHRRFRSADRNNGRASARSRPATSVTLVEQRTGSR